MSYQSIHESLNKTTVRPLRIAIVADPFIPVPPIHYGGIERVIAMLVNGLLVRGHQVVLWAARGSDVPCEVVEYGFPPHETHLQRTGEIMQIAGGLIRRRNHFDVVHSFGRLAGLLPLLPLSLPKLQSYQRPISAKGIKVASRLAGPTILFTACSTNCRKNVSHIGDWETVYNGVQPSTFTFTSSVPADAPLVFLGRIEKIKGTQEAIEIALATDRKLIIAGNVSTSPEAQHYYETKVAPFVDNDQISYVGPVDDVAKNELLGRAAALLMPISWEEPFGIVMAEALACGTPVIGLRRGSVPEVIEDGRTGFVCDDLDEMKRAVARLTRIDRIDCRNRCEQFFSENTIVGDYESLYNKMITKR